MEPDDPPRKNYATKPREFERVNAPSSAVPPMPTAQDLAKLAGSPVPTRPGPGRPKADDPNDVYAVLQQNRAVAQKHGQNEVVIKKTISRRKRDFWLLIVPSNLLLAVLTWQGRGDPLILVCGLSGMVVASLSITWIMWQVMNDY
jgi:hypothetical protein